MEQNTYELPKYPQRGDEHKYDSIQQNIELELCRDSDAYLEPINQVPKKDSEKETPSTSNICKCNRVSVVLSIVSAISLTALIILIVVCVSDQKTTNKSTSQQDGSMSGLGNTTNGNKDNTNMTQFAVMFAKNFVTANIELIITTESDGFGRYSVPPESFICSSITTNIIRAFYSKDIITKRNTIENKGVIINSRSDSLVIGFSTYFGLSTRCCSSDAFNAIAAPNLGREYMVVTLSEAYTFKKYIGVVALHNNTKITFKLNTTDNPDTKNITLNSKDTYQLTTVNDTDLTGSIIKGDKSFAVFSGDECEIYQGGGCSHTVENIPKIADLGKHYIIPEFRNITSVFVKIVPTKPNTFISITSSKSATNHITSNHIQIIIDKATTTYVSASSQILVSAYASFNSQFYFMTLIPPICQYSNNFILVTPSLKRFYNFCSVIIESRYADRLILNKTPLKLSSIDERVSLLGNKSWRTITFLLPDGASTLRHPNIDVKFAFIQYGRGSDNDTVYDNYAFPSKFNFDQSTSKCNI